MTRLGKGDIATKLIWDPGWDLRHKKDMRKISEI